MRRQRGAALLLVLWVLALLSVLLGGLAGWVQLESRQALWLRQHTNRTGRRSRYRPGHG